MRTQNLVASLLVLTFVVASAQAQTVNRSRAAIRTAVPAAATAPTRQSVQTPVQAVALPRAPDVVGLSLSDAYSVVDRAGIFRQTVYVENTDDTVPYNHVGATVPAAGQVVTDALILQVPRPAAHTFAGALSLTDIVRRDGFDLDQGRYEQILRGADMVLKEDKTSIPNVDPNGGSTYYTTKGLFVEPSDGAVFAVPGLYGVSVDGYPGGLASAPNYFACRHTLEGARAPYLNLPRADAYGTDLVFCVLTSNRQVAVVHFRQRDMACCGKDNYKFYIAVFPQQKITGLRRRDVLASPERLTH